MELLKSVNGSEYLVINLVEINQKGQTFYFGKLLASQMLEIFTVRPAVYDVKKNMSLAKSFTSEKEYYEHLAEKNKSTISEKDFQREFDQSRVSDIVKYIEHNEYPFFPNTIIANCELINDYEEFNIDSDYGIEGFLELDDIPSHLSYLYSKNGTNKIVIPNSPDSLLIIDGQHRLEGLRRVDQDILSDYELMVSFLVTLDRATIAQQFYTINYEQKPVNKSLLYHLTGEFSTDLNELTFLHYVVKILNELESSPLQGRIKMLGVNPPNLSKELKKRLSVSQAFLIDQLKRTISNRNYSGIYQPIFLDFYLDESKQIFIIKFLIKYFSSLANLIPNWEDPEKSLVSKGMGLGAFIKVLHLIYPIILLDRFGGESQGIVDMNIGEIEKLLAGAETVDFSREGKHGGVGSSGSINKIKEEIIESLEFLSFDNYSDFETSFRNDYLPKFKEWVSGQTK